MKKLFSIIGWPLLFVVGQLFIILVATLLFIVMNKSLYSHIGLFAWIETTEYTSALNQFLSNYGVLILIITFLIFFPILYKKYHKEVKVENKKIGLLNLIFLMFLGFSFSLIYNCILLNINYFYPIPSLFEEDTTSFLTILIGTVLVGPILEEYIFRGIVYHRLQKYYPLRKSLILTGVVFALFHSNLFQIIYAFIFNFILIYVYERFYSLKASILVHISGNTVSLIISYLIGPNLWIVEFVLIISCALLIGSYFGLQDKKKF